MRVLLIAGGWSNEREVSLSGARGIDVALRSLGHEVVLLDPAHEFAALTDAAAGADFAFINLHGSPGEDGLIQAMLDAVGCPYQGSGPEASFKALHKATAKVLATRAGVPTPKWKYLTHPPGVDWLCGLDYPVFAKSVTGGSSLTMGLARDTDELRAVLKNIFDLGLTALVEEAVSGSELTCAVLGDEVLPPILIRPQSGAAFFDYESKYVQGKAEEICPAPVEPEVTARVQELSLTVHRVLGLSGCSRSDFILREDGEPLFLEVNTLPGMTPTSLVPQAAAAVGLDFPQLVARLIELGLARAERHAR